jgi:hypothetical protein
LLAFKVKSNIMFRGHGGHFATKAADKAPAGTPGSITAGKSAP